jgi:hypothetical protein
MITNTDDSADLIDEFFGKTSRVLSKIELILERERTSPKFAQADPKDFLRLRDFALQAQQLLAIENLAENLLLSFEKDRSVSLVWMKTSPTSDPKLGRTRFKMLTVNASRHHQLLRFANTVLNENGQLESNSGYLHWSVEIDEFYDLWKWFETKI